MSKKGIDQPSPEGPSKPSRTAQSGDQGFTRRDFLTVSGTLALAAGAGACGRVGTDENLATRAVQDPTVATPSTLPPSPTTTSSQGPTEAPARTEPPDPTETLAPSSSPTPRWVGENNSPAVAFVKTTDRKEGVRRALNLLGISAMAGKSVVLKPNLNSADPAPGSTHMDVLRTLVDTLWDQGARSICVADRSGMGDTRTVMKRTGVLDLAEELGLDIQVLDDLQADAWVTVQPQDSHWARGFLFPRSFLEADAIVQTCCLKTHRYGGHFTLSLKNSVGMVAKFGADGYDYMRELHSSPHQRKMIAEINASYEPVLVVLDGVEAFVNGGPATGTKVQSEVILAGTDRIALDAVGVAILRYFGTTPEVEQGRVFEQEQIARAAALGLGAASPEDIRFLSDDAASAEYAAQIQEVLLSS